MNVRNTILLFQALVLTLVLTFNAVNLETWDQYISQMIIVHIAEDDLKI